MNELDKEFSKQISDFKKLILETNNKAQDYYRYYLEQTADIWNEIDRLRKEIEQIKQ